MQAGWGQWEGRWEWCRLKRAALGENKVTAQDMLAARMHAVMCEMRAREQRQTDRKRVRETAAADGEPAPTAPNGMPRGTLRVATHTIANFRKSRGQITNSRTSNARGKKVKTPHIQYAQVYPEKTSLEQEEGIWDGRPKRARVAEGFYDQVRRRGTRARYEDEEPTTAVKRKKGAMVPAGPTGVDRRWAG